MHQEKQQLRFQGLKKECALGTRLADARAVTVLCVSP